jgi:3-deoxy-D-manno-octulosonic-acid transferase
MSDFPEISQMLLRAKGAVQVKNPKDLYHRVRDLLTDPAKGEIIGTHAFEVFQANQGAVEKTAAVIKQIDRYFHEQ